MDLVERLRRLQIDDKRTVDALCHEAADEIERLRGQNTALRRLAAVHRRRMPWD